MKTLSEKSNGNLVSIYKHVRVNRPSKNCALLMSRYREDVWETCQNAEVNHSGDSDTIKEEEEEEEEERGIRLVGLCYRNTSKPLFCL